MSYYLCYRPCSSGFKGRHVYPLPDIGGKGKPTLSSSVNQLWIVLNEQEREIYRDYMVKEGYNYEDC